MLVLIIGILIGVMAAGVAAPVHYRYIGPGGNLVANGGGVLDGHADHRALTIYSSKVAEINIAHAHEINWNKTKPFLIGWSVISILLGLYLSWPIWGLYVAALAPRDFFQVWTYITLVPILSLFPTLMPRVTQACDRLCFRRPMDSIVSAFNRLRHALPEVTKLAIVISAICFGQSHLPHGASTTTYGNSDAQNLSKFSPSLSADASNSGSFLSSLPEPINALTLPYVGEWHAATRSFDAEPGALNLPLTSTISQQALANVTIKAVEKSFDTKLPLIAASPDSGATASITADCNNLESTRKCDEVFGAANGAITRCTCIGDMPIITRTTSGDLVRFKFTNVRCVPGFRYTLLSVTQIWNEQKIDARFCDLNHLQLPQSAGGHTVPYDRSLTLSTLILVSEARLDRKHMIAKSRADHQHLAGPGWKANIYPGDVGHLNQHHALLGFHSVTSSAHLGKLSKAQISELYHRRIHCGVDKQRAIYNTTRNAPKNLTASSPCSCTHCAAVRIKKASHSSSLDTPPPAPGKLHVDLKGPLQRSVEGFCYAAFFIDENTRNYFVRFLKTKDELGRATLSVMSEFNATVATPLDSNGTPMERPKVFAINTDHEGHYESKNFESFREKHGIHLTMSPPHDHDLNPIAERAIGSISELSAIFRAQSGAPIGFWPYLVRHAVHVHNSTIGSTGSATGDPNVTPHQRFTGGLPDITDLATIGCRCVVLKPPTHRKKSDLSPPGWVGCFLGRSASSIGAWDVWVPSEKKIVTSSSVKVDEETFPWLLDKAHQPLRPTSSAAPLPEPDSLKAPNVAASETHSETHSIAGPAASAKSSLTTTCP